MSNTEEKDFILGEIEELVILAILRLGPHAYGVALQDLLEKATKKTVNVRGLYTTLQRLQNKGLIKPVETGETVSRGGRARRYYATTASGKLALRRTAAKRKAWDEHRISVQATTPIPAK